MSNKHHDDKKDKSSSSSSKSGGGKNNNNSSVSERNFDGDRNAFIPPGAQCRVQSGFGNSFQQPFTCPKRLKNRPHELIEAVNDFHFSMLNDTPRNQFYLDCLKEVIDENSIVLEIGTGTGLLSMLAAKLGAKKVYAIEANTDMAHLAEDNIRKNNLDKIIKVCNCLSFDFTEKMTTEKPNVILSEVFGTLLLGESAHVYIDDALKRLCAPNTKVVPRCGTQFASLICSPGLEKFTGVDTWNGIDLSTLNGLRDTASVVFTKSYGFRLSTIPYEEVCERIAVIELDFATCDSEKMQRQKKFRVKCTKSGVVHAVMLYWEAYSDLDKKYVMSTDPEANKDNMCRDMQWGQALQLVEDFKYNGDQPVPFKVTAGEEIEVGVVFSSDGVLMQFRLTHAAKGTDAE